METQDSLDIAKLQRVALGLEHEPSQSFLPGQGNPDISKEPRLFRSPPDRHSQGGTSSALQQVFPPFVPRQHEQPLIPNSSAAEPNKINTVPAHSSRNMDPAETPGDTQPVSQSVYDSIIRQNGESMHGGLSETGADGATLRTLHEGDSGHIDLLAGFDSVQQNPITSPDLDDDSNYDQSESSPLAYQPELFPESQRFLADTPATAVKKIKTPGTISQTPSLSRNPLAGAIESSGGLMGLSQVFKPTQAPSSPLVHGQPELVSDRPSPNLPIQPIRVTNHASSPLMHHAPVHSESSEPNLNYISMKESQNRRDKSLGERPTRSVDNMEPSDQIDDEFYKESSFVENARRRHQINEETAEQFAALDTPSASKDHLVESPVQPTEQNQDDDVEMYDIERPRAAGSESETEQEDDLAPQVPQSQELHSSEEDKENYNGPSAPVIGTSSAHDRLSQALSFEANGHVPDESAADAGRRDDQQLSSFHGKHSGRSSQVMVKDSQQSPQPTPKANHDQNRERPPSHETRLGPTPVIDVAGSSPVRRSVRSSPPISLPPQPSWSESNENTQHRISQPMPGVDQNPTNEDRPPHSSNPSEQANTGSLSRRTQSQPDSGHKPSSMPSRVTETPLHQKPHSGEIGKLTSIPETTPNRAHSNEWEVGTNEDGRDDGHNEDDDLPPMRVAGNSQRIGQLQPSQNRTAHSSPIKVLQTREQTQILSSPSGRQRRALTEIASDRSPQVDPWSDLSVNLLTAEDEHFHAVTDGSPTRPKKRRRGNLGQSFHTSDTVGPSTPRGHPPKTTAPSQKVPSPARTPSPVTAPVPAPSTNIPTATSTTTTVTTTTARKRGRPRRTENVYDVPCSPQQPPPPRRSRSAYRKSSTLRRVEETRSRSRKREIKLAKPTAKPLVVIHNSQSASQSGSQPPSQTTPSSQLTNVDFGSDDMLPSESTAVNSPPITPRASHATSDNQPIAPKQVLAVWMGQKRAYYPATCLGTPLGVAQTKYTVKFEDSAPVEVIKGAVKRLELRVGDGVKVDMREIPKVTHIIRGFEDKLTREDLARAADKGIYPQTDIYGYRTLVLGPKQRKSLPNGGFSGSENVIKVPIAKIYLDTILWNQLKDRMFTYEAEKSHDKRSHTPSEKSSLPASPGARFSRSIQIGNGIFANMVFAVSYKDDEASKNRITTLIGENGGSILHGGFTELFEPSSILHHASPKKGLSANASRGDGMRLKSHAENIGFACLVTDSHSRREKYMQALALNLPCLSGRWIEDCVAQGRVIDWDVYLLPSGDSMYLHGATKSRIMAPTPPLEARLTETIATRPKLLDGKKVLIITGRGKAEERRKAYIFLTFALGAAHVERVPDLESAREMIDSQSNRWDLIYVDDSDQASAKSMLTPRPKSQRIKGLHGSQGRKRKSAVLDLPSSSSDSSAPVRVVGNEFVCQSLILGRLFEE
ncbi:hypothetical protein N7492_000513 [Penicillium capsulatum]|uniref:BRCT domain-containing protein n=1 Tax=Penicillium capsulatum TaxID=69766 RepID=A0A9W9IRV5_9EURO|nr:hypothetical protein N7492_000513 [Penicillium capsulatum]KAJ6130429.1 hypothetical protein N7512_003209 [Penicillium capsulatum]